VNENLSKSRLSQASISSPSVSKALLFHMPRASEFASERELTAQIGHPPEDWPIVGIRELIDNALDAAEGPGQSPAIAVKIGPEYIDVEDNGPGIPAEAILGAADFDVRVSAKVGIAAPTRGQQGYGLKVVLAMPYARTGRPSVTTFYTQGECITVTLSRDELSQLPVSRITRGPSETKTGNIVRLDATFFASSNADPETPSFYHAVRNLLLSFHFCNAHASFALETVDGVESWPATTEAPSHIWGSETSPHWYSEETLARLMSATANVDDGTTVRSLVGRFRGLTGSAKAKAVTDAAGLSGVRLRDIVTSEGVDRDAVARLLAAMKAEAKVVKPEHLGHVGQAHLHDALDAELHFERDRKKDPNLDTFEYRSVLGETSSGVPFVVEVAFAPNGSLWLRSRLATNWSPQLAHDNVVGEIASNLGMFKEPFLHAFQLIGHVVTPVLVFGDRGKTQPIFAPEIKAALTTAIVSTTKAWRARRDREHRATRAERVKTPKGSGAPSLKDAARQVLPEALALVTDNGRLPGNARQIMYAVRGPVLGLTGGRIWSEDSYFTQGILPDYVAEMAQSGIEWDVVFDARGHFEEPHTGRRVELGTVRTRDYVGGWDAHDTATPSFTYSFLGSGPSGRFTHALFLEKEGFEALMAAARIPERFDIATFSTKGMPTTAARMLVEELSAAGVTICVAHDMDASGFLILDTLRSNTRRYEFKTEPRIIDLGLRLADAEEMNLEREPVVYKQGADPRPRLFGCGATAAEVNVLVQRQASSTSWAGERIELNAMTSPQFVRWLEKKLTAAGAAKVIPTSDVLAQAWADAARLPAIDQAAQKAATGFRAPAPPADLEARIRSRLAAHPDHSWDSAMADIVAGEQS